MGARGTWPNHAATALTRGARIKTVDEHMFYDMTLPVNAAIPKLQESPWSWRLIDLSMSGYHLALESALPTQSESDQTTSTPFCIMAVYVRC